jgi:hypothetical protein
MTNHADNLRLKYEVRAIARVLKWNFPLSEPTDRYNVMAPSGCRYHFSRPWREPHRLSITASDPFGQYQRTTITVARKRPPKDIVREMARRIAPGLKVDFERNKKQKEDEKARQLAVIAAARQLSTAQGIRFHSPTSRRRARHSQEAVIDFPARGRCEIDTDRETGKAECSIAITVTPETAQKIINLLREEATA